MDRLTHFSLFSGIGGIDLAAEWAGFTTVGQCEFADYPTSVLEKHWKNVPKWRDIRDVTAESFRERTGLQELGLLSGGFPCQPHSLAGKRQASGDERDLWGEFARVICEIRPKWVLGENVRGLLSSENGRFFGRILRDFSEMGYNVGWGCYGADKVGAVHKRERVFVVAYANGKRWNSMDENKQNRLSILDIQKYIREKAKRNFTNDILYDLEWSFSNPKCGIIRNDDGLSEGMDRLKCLGNAVVPQQVYPILQAIAEIEDGL